MKLEGIQIARCYQPADFGKVTTAELHHFSDASTTGYGQCTYPRLMNERGDVHCTFLLGKARVLPLKVTTIPRLELTAAVVSVTVSNMLKEELGYSDIEEFYWTDSKVVLGYINNDACRFHTFVANRVQKIRHASDPKRTFTYQLMTTRQTVLQGGQQWTNCFYLVGSQALAFCGKKK